MEALLQNLIRATGWSILHSLWQGAIIYGILLLTQMNAAQLKAKTKYLFAYGASCLMFVCFIGTFLLAFDWTVSAAGHAPATPAAAYQIALPTLSQYAEMLFPYLVCLYSMGIVIQSALVLSGYRKISGIKKAAHTSVPESWKSLFETLTKKLSIKKEVTFWLSAHVQVPLIIGYLKPVVLFPIGLAAQMDLSQVEAILIHELSHVRRNDYLFNLIRTMVDTVLFFNPFIWLSGKFIDIEREHACDDLVLELTHTPMTYAHALLKLELLTDKGNPVLALAATGKKQYLYQRIKRITDMKTNYMNSKQKLFAVSLTIATVVSLAWITPSKNEVKLNSPGHQQQQVAVKQTAGNKVKIKLPEISAVCIPADTTKKKAKKKIVMFHALKDSNNVFIAMPDSLSEQINISVKNALKPLENMNFELDSTISNAVKAYAYTVDDATKARALYIGDPEKLAKIRKEMTLKGQKMAAEFNKPEHIAKLKKYAQDMQAKYNSPEQREKIIKLSEELAKISKDKMIVISPNFKYNLNELKFNAVPNLSGLENLNSNNAIKRSPEYIELKKKFDNDVQELINNKLKKEPGRN
jgi:bla regulator protein BlaR1